MVPRGILSFRGKTVREAVLSANRWLKATQTTCEVIGHSSLYDCPEGAQEGGVHLHHITVCYRNTTSAHLGMASCGMQFFTGEKPFEADRVAFDWVRRMKNSCAVIDRSSYFGIEKGGEGFHVITVRYKSAGLGAWFR